MDFVHRFATVGRGAALAAALVLPVALAACESPATVPSPQPRVFRVAEADDQRLPAHHACPAPNEGMITGTHFIEGELTLYPESLFTWRYTIEQYVTRNGEEQVWVEPFAVTGSYVLRGDSLDLLTGDDVARTGRVRGDVVELAEVIPCRFLLGADALHETELYLTEER